MKTKTKVFEYYGNLEKIPQKYTKVCKREFSCYFVGHIYTLYLVAETARALSYVYIAY